MKALVDTLTERKEAERLAYSEQGAQLVSVSVIGLFDEIERIINEGAASSNVIKFSFRRPMQHILYVNTVYGMYLGISLRDFYLNSVTNAQLEAKVFKRQFGAFGEPEGNGQIFEKLNFKPSFRAGDVIWIPDDEDKHVFLTSELAAHLVGRLVEYVGEQAATR